MCTCKHKTCLVFIWFLWRVVHKCWQYFETSSPVPNECWALLSSNRFPIDRCADSNTDRFLGSKLGHCQVSELLACHFVVGLKGRYGISDSGTKCPNMVCEVWVESDQTCTSGNGYVSEQSNAWADKIGLSLLFSSDYSTSWCLSNWLFNTNSFFPTHPPLFHLVVEISVSITVGIWKGSCLVGNDPLRPKLGRLEPKGYAGRYLYCQVAFWAKLYSPILKNPKLPSSTPRGK